MNYKMDYVRSYVVPSLHYAEVVHLREDEDDETSISAASTSSSSSSVIEVETKTHRIEANSSLTSYESTHSIDIPSVFHNHSNLRILDELRRDSNDKKEIESLKLNNNNNIDSGLVNDENFQNTTEEIDIDAILGYPNSNEDSCLQNDTITVVDEELDLTNNVPSMDEDHEFRDEVKKKHSSPKKLKDKYSVFEKIKLTLSRKKYDQNDSELSSDEKGNQKKIDNIHNKGDSLNISDENHFGLVGEKKKFYQNYEQIT
nr:uncharacterized protein LOC121114069 isoform X2 [Lepeophtheirus salmonis]XP_040563856.1 uncharacterized protein LOC121114069 isoform X2 [Lepeophtheirus salmonis]